jgi:hypothetical protein
MEVTPAYVENYLGYQQRIDGEKAYSSMGMMNNKSISPR